MFKTLVLNIVKFIVGMKMFIKQTIQKDGLRYNG